MKNKLDYCVACGARNPPLLHYFIMSVWNVVQRGEGCLLCQRQNLAQSLYASRFISISLTVTAQTQTAAMLNVCSVITTNISNGS